MRIWKISICLDSAQLTVENEKDDEYFENGFKGYSIMKDWKSPNLITFQNGEIGDLLSYKGFSSILFFSEKALETVQDLIDKKVEILPVVYPPYNYCAINCINILDCIDYEQSVPDKYGGFDKYSFIEDAVRGQHVFKTVSKINPFGDFQIISVTTFVSDELKTRVEESGLKGFRFSPVWASDSSESKEIFREYNPSFRFTDTDDYKQHIEEHYGPIVKHYEGTTNSVSDVELYLTAPNPKVPFYTMTTLGNSYFRMMSPASVDSGYAEVVMHLPKGMDITQLSVDDPQYGWVVRLLRDFGNETMKKGFWLGQWLAFPNQPYDDLKNTYGHFLGGGNYDPSEHMEPYDESTTYCGVLIVPPLPQCAEVFKMPYRDNGKVIAKEWPVYFHTLLPLYKEEILYYYKEGRERFLQRLMQNGIKAAFDLNRENTCK